MINVNCDSSSLSRAWISIDSVCCVVVRQSDKILSNDFWIFRGLHCSSFCNHCRFISTMFTSALSIWAWRTFCRFRSCFTRLVKTKQVNTIREPLQKSISLEFKLNFQTGQYYSGTFSEIEQFRAQSLNSISLEFVTIMMALFKRIYQSDRFMIIVSRIAITDFEQNFSKSWKNAPFLSFYR